jgi:hypothetical protein
MPSATQNSQSSSSTSASPSSSSSPSSGVSNRMGAGVRVYLAIGWMAALTVLLV